MLVSRCGGDCATSCRERHSHTPGRGAPPTGSQVCALPQRQPGGAVRHRQACGGRQHGSEGQRAFGRPLPACAQRTRTGGTAGQDVVRGGTWCRAGRGAGRGGGRHVAVLQLPNRAGIPEERSLLQTGLVTAPMAARLRRAVPAPDSSWRRQGCVCMYCPAGSLDGTLARSILAGPVQSHPAPTSAVLGCPRAASLAPRVAAAAARSPFPLLPPARTCRRLQVCAGRQPHHRVLPRHHLFRKRAALGHSAYLGGRKAAKQGFAALSYEGQPQPAASSQRPAASGWRATAGGWWQAPAGGKMHAGCAASAWLRRFGCCFARRPAPACCICRTGPGCRPRPRPCWGMPRAAPAAPSGPPALAYLVPHFHSAHVTPHFHHRAAALGARGEGQVGLLLVAPLQAAGRARRWRRVWRSRRGASAGRRHSLRGAVPAGPLQAGHRPASLAKQKHEGGPRHLPHLQLQRVCKVQRSRSHADPHAVWVRERSGRQRRQRQRAVRPAQRLLGVSQPLTAQCCVAPWLRLLLSKGSAGGQRACGCSLAVAAVGGGTLRKHPWRPASAFRSHSDTMRHVPATPGKSGTLLAMAFGVWSVPLLVCSAVNVLRALQQQSHRAPSR